MRIRMYLALTLAVTLLIGHSSVYGQVPLGSAFTYQGQLKDGGIPADGDYDFVFRLFDDPNTGTQIGSDFPVDGWPVSNGLFTVPLDFGAGAFTSDARWIEIDVRDGAGGSEYTTLSPRQPVTAAPIALYALGGPGSGGYWAASGDDIYSTNAGGVGIGTTTPASVLDVQSTEGTHGIMSTVPWIPVWAHRTGTSGTWPAIHGECDSDDPDGSAVRGIMTSASSGSDSAGVRGTNSGRGFGVYGSSTGVAGVAGEVDSDWAAAVRGFNHATGFGYGIYGVHYGEGWGACGISFESTGVYGLTHADWYGAGVHGHSNGAFGYGVKGTTDGGGIGVYGDVPSGIGVFGDSTDGTGVHGTTDSVASNAMGVQGVINSTSPGGYSAGVRGQNNGTAGNGIGVYGSQNGSGWGVYGYTPSGRGVYGLSAGGTGVYGHNSDSWSGQGVRGTHAGYGVGVYGESSGGFGVYAKSTSGDALYAEAADGRYAARFVGNVRISSSSSGQTLIEFGEGLDYAEGFDVSNESRITPGTVLVIDVENAGKLAMSNAPYDRKVAGIVAGANGLGSAVRLGAGQFDFDVALAGRVYCNVDASHGAIQPGDLLTTSPTPGYAMKVTDREQAQGAILGKAMQPLEQGEQGQILVLVTLQ